MKIGERLKNGWNAFFNTRDPTKADAEQQYIRYADLGTASYIRPDRTWLKTAHDRSFITSILTRIAIDTASIPIRHVRVDENDQYTDTINDSLNKAFNLSANWDQTGFLFRLDFFQTLLDCGTAVIVPTDTDKDPEDTESPGIIEVRVGKVKEWFPKAVRVDCYNERKGKHEQIILPKALVAIVENPFYPIMNDPSSAYKRLGRKLALLDKLDGESASGKLDMIIQLPYTIKTDLQRQQADKRRREIETQLAKSKYGIAYTDGTEHVTQLNRAIENNLLPQIEYLTKQVLDELGITADILNGTADEAKMLNYYNRICEPLLTALVDELKRKFLTSTGLAQGQSIKYFREPFKLVPAASLADVADRFTRNEIMSSNEMRSVIGFKPVNTARANELRNKNINSPEDNTQAGANVNVADQFEQQYAEYTKNKGKGV